MWLFHPLGFASIVEDRNTSQLIARSRFQGDLQRLFPEHKAAVKKTPSHDYRFRVPLTRTYVAARLAELAKDINYDNFKNATAKDRHTVYLRVWSTMYNEQERRYPPKQSRYRQLVGGTPQRRQSAFVDPFYDAPTQNDLLDEPAGHSYLDYLDTNR